MPIMHFGAVDQFIGAVSDLAFDSGNRLSWRNFQQCFHAVVSLFNLQCLPGPANFHVPVLKQNRRRQPLAKVIFVPSKQIFANMKSDQTIAHAIADMRPLHEITRLTKGEISLR